jgi:2-hydroxy-6-oxonona-2,4-dienedioate hydrolase
MKNEKLILDNKDPKVISARKAEKALFDLYNIKPKEQYVRLPDKGIKVRILEFGSGEPLVFVPGNTGFISINRPGGG